MKNKKPKRRVLWDTFQRWVNRAKAAEARATQIALDLVDVVRAKEAAEKNLNAQITIGREMSTALSKAARVNKALTDRLEEAWRREDWLLGEIGRRGAGTPQEGSPVAKEREDLLDRARSADTACWAAKKSFEAGEGIRAMLEKAPPSPHEFVRMSGDLKAGPGRNCKHRVVGMDMTAPGEDKSFFQTVKVGRST